MEEMPNPDGREVTPLVKAIDALQTIVIPYIFELPEGGGYIMVKAAALRKLLIERLAKQV